MGAWSAAILGNDTSCEVHERFMELYDFGIDPKKIAVLILKEQEENIQYDRTNVWLGLALSCWECKTLTKEIFEEIKNIIDSKEDIIYNEELDADTAFLKKRQKVLDEFIAKISTEKEKPRARKKVPIQVESQYVPGMCFSYKNPNGKYIGIYLTDSEHYKNKGSINFWFLDFESDTIPELPMFSNAKLFGLEKLGPGWGSREYKGNVTDLQYEKATKASFFDNVPNLLIYIGKLNACDNNRFTNNYRGVFMNLDDPNDIIRALEMIRTEGKVKHELSSLTLNQLIDKIKI